ncbi:MAG TPA: PhzF family phenazine biosynthesis protein [Candidatus Binatus sp.]|nr:PhzF family phenazine biosynthesis protein [Candidatus Binatus sp.]
MSKSEPRKRRAEQAIRSQTTRFQRLSPPHQSSQPASPASETFIATAITIKAMRIPLFHVDAFTNQLFRGNPAAVCPLDAWLDDELLQKVAAENNLSETAFFVPERDRSDDELYDLRWFTPRGEVKLCGHATLASAYVLLNLLQSGSHEVRFETRSSGTLTVRKDGEIFAMDFPAMLARPCTNAPDALISALAPGPRPSQVMEVNDTYIAIYDHASTIRNMRPDFARLARLHPFVVSVTAPGNDADFVSRYFKPSYGMPEDPVTGSAHCALTPYWAERLGKTQLHARQLSERGGELWCDLAGNRVTLKGNAVLTMQGTLTI